MKAALLPGILGSGGVLTLIALGFLAAPAAAQAKGVGDQSYRPAPHDGQFRKHYPEAEALFNAFDYGYAILFERIPTDPNPPVNRLEVEVYGKLAGEVLRTTPKSMAIVDDQRYSKVFSERSPTSGRRSMMPSTSSWIRGASRSPRWSGSRCRCDMAYGLKEVPRSAG